MNITFNADEVFEIAEQIERNGAEFYRRAAEMFSDTDSHKLLAELAEWEIQHESLFADMRKRVPQGKDDIDIIDPDDVAARYLKAMAGDHVFRASSNVEDYLKGDESIEEVLAKAIQFEKDSIVLFMGMLDLVPDGLGKDGVARILGEEKKHVVMLSDRLSKLEK
ncbi:MAG: ferritin family protein [Candidatus Coatesbacteria bacterium]|nr:ferritin family protein [Candidatus Coatesbacteria bacterium]